MTAALFLFCFSFYEERLKGMNRNIMIVNPMSFDVLGEPLSAQECLAKHECKALELLAKPKILSPMIER
jgi:hypothetical protein